MHVRRRGGKRGLRLDTPAASAADTRAVTDARLTGCQDATGRTGRRHSRLTLAEPDDWCIHDAEALAGWTVPIISGLVLPRSADEQTTLAFTGTTEAITLAGGAA